MLLNFINSSNQSKVSSSKRGEDLNSNMHTIADLEACVADSCKMVANTYGLFKNNAKEQVPIISIHFLASYNVCCVKSLGSCLLIC